MQLYFPGKRKKKELIVTIHGFGTKASDEMKPLAAYLRQEGYKVITFDIFNPRNPKDSNPARWISRCEDEIRKALAQNEQVVLIGFSMGGVIASYLASIFPVKKLILVAPAFNYLDLSKIEQVGKGILSGGGSSSELTTAQKQAFMNVVSRYRSSITAVDCPVFLIHGTADEVIPPRSSRKAYYAIPHERKRLFYLEGGKHRLLYDGKLEKSAFALIRDFLQDNMI